MKETIVGAPAHLINYTEIIKRGKQFLAVFGVRLELI